jgi:predicted transcriptional regulator
MRRPDPEIPKNIARLISKKPFGLTIGQISRELKINRITATKYLNILESQKRVLVRDIGNSKLHYPRTRRVESWLL